MQATSKVCLGDLSLVPSVGWERSRCLLSVKGLCCGGDI